MESGVSQKIERPQESSNSKILMIVSCVVAVIVAILFGRSSSSSSLCLDLSNPELSIESKLSLLKSAYNFQPITKDTLQPTLALYPVSNCEHIFTVTQDNSYIWNLTSSKPIKTYSHCSFSAITQKKDFIICLYERDHIGKLNTETFIMQDMTKSNDPILKISLFTEAPYILYSYLAGENEKVMVKDIMSHKTLGNFDGIKGSIRKMAAEGLKNVIVQDSEGIKIYEFGTQGPTFRVKDQETFKALSETFPGLKNF
ncbi:hypothetical protein SteCoe_27933 [Stentor coeruleus]|uniref:Uncharacterized protein n=1 Tax=Stentor coeruleus TaxID=5963 RepID=A0A1R2B9D5_9CILI|nr:hypothetical protein SteCoe_27933 [Stentor coeruleus]